MELIKWIQFSILILNFGRLMAIPDREKTDYCEMFGKDDIQGKREYCFLFSSDLTLYIFYKGKKHAFLAGNKVYYVSNTKKEDGQFKETIGLTHPFYHDLRSRGTGIAYQEEVGTGNDFYGWEFHKNVKVAFGSIVSENMKWEHPAPSRMFWRPDKMIMEYDLSSPYIEVGTYVKENVHI